MGNQCPTCCNKAVREQEQISSPNSSNYMSILDKDSDSCKIRIGDGKNIKIGIHQNNSEDRLILPRDSEPVELISQEINDHDFKNNIDRLKETRFRSNQLQASRQLLTISNVIFSPEMATRVIISSRKRLKHIEKYNLQTSNDRLRFFRKDLEKRRISFLEDSITLVINRESVVEDTLNQIASTDRFSMHKEIKIFFVGEEAQDEGCVFKEWI